MGNKPPPPVQKTPKELQRELNRSIDRMVRDFTRDKMRVNMEISKAKRDLERMVKNGEPRSSQKYLAQNIIKNENFMRKYDTLEARMKGVKIQWADQTGERVDHPGHGRDHEGHGTDHGQGHRCHQRQ